MQVMTIIVLLDVHVALCCQLLVLMQNIVCKIVSKVDISKFQFVLTPY